MRVKKGSKIQRETTVQEVSNFADLTFPWQRVRVGKHGADVR